MQESESPEEKGTALIRHDIAAQAHDKRMDETTIYTCPDCGGTLWQVNHHGLTQFRCHVGHVYGTEVLLSEKSDELEAALWRCVRMLAEKATLTRQVARRLRTEGQVELAGRIEDQAALDDRHGQLVRDLLQEDIGSPATEAFFAAEIPTEPAV